MTSGLALGLSALPLIIVTASMCCAKYSYITRASSTFHSFLIHQSCSSNNSSGTAVADVTSHTPSWPCICACAMITPGMNPRL
eukprot:4743810-Amphidinium_carterae.1